MLKKMTTVLLCTLLGNTLYAGDDIDQSKPFIGLELGYATVQGSAYNESGVFPVYEPDYEGSDIEYGIRIGAQREEWRTTLSFNYFDSDKDDRKQNYEKVLASLDYFFLYSSQEKSQFQPFLGINLGYVNYESTQDIDMDGFIYGAQAGVLFHVTDTIDIDLLYRYSLSSATQDDRNAELDHIGSIVFGINYIY